MKNNFNNVGLWLDQRLHSRSSTETLTYAYGRGLEQASGLGFWFFAATMFLGVNFGVNGETLGLNNFFWAWLAAVMGFCQLYYPGLTQRRVFNLLATAAWLTIAFAATSELGGWNLITAISLPYCLCSFYVYSFLFGQEGFQTQRSEK